MMVTRAGRTLDGSRDRSRSSDEPDKSDGGSLLDLSYRMSCFVYGGVDVPSHGEQVVKVGVRLQAPMY
jgi:hypothetical protein